MTTLYRKLIGCKDSHEKSGQPKQLQTTTSQEPQQITIKALSYLAASLLVTASAGFGAIFAWNSGSQHGLALGALSVAMALGLEICKPLAVAGALTALRRFAIVQASLLFMLGAVAVAFSLTSELSLMATSRGDMAAARKAESQDAIERERKAKELAEIGTTRPSAAIQAELDALLIDKRLNDCEGWVESPRLRVVCGEKVAPLKAEHAKAERKEKLEAELATTGKAAVHKQADPAASALSTYLAALGLTVNADALSEWLVLVPVIALEFGSALAGVLIGATRSSVQASVHEPAKTESEQDLSPDTASVHDIASLACPIERLKLVLAQSGGQVFSGQRALAKAVGVSVGAVNTMLDELSRAGQITVDATAKGTKVKLIAA